MRRFVDGWVLLPGAGDIADVLPALLCADVKKTVAAQQLARP